MEDMEVAGKGSEPERWIEGRRDWGGGRGEEMEREKEGGLERGRD